MCYGTLQYARLVFLSGDNGHIFRHGIDFPVNSICGIIDSGKSGDGLGFGGSERIA